MYILNVCACVCVLDKMWNRLRKTGMQKMHPQDTNKLGNSFEVLNTPSAELSVFAVLQDTIMLLSHTTQQVTGRLLYFHKHRQ